MAKSDPDPAEVAADDQTVEEIRADKKPSSGQRVAEVLQRWRDDCAEGT